MRFKYVGDCKAGFVEFKHADHGVTRMPRGEAVEVPEYLAKKLATNGEFEQVADSGKGKTAKTE